MRTAAVTAAPSLPLDVRAMEWSARALALAGALLILGLLLAWMLRHPTLSFSSIRLEGELNRSSLATIRANALPQLRGNFFTVDLQDSRRAFESVPWIRHAEVQRRWPGELRVRLQEHRAVALWEDVAGRERREDRLVGADGRVFQANPGDIEDENLPQFRGPEGSSSRMWAAFEPLQRALGPVGQLSGGREAATIRVLQLSSKGSWTVELDSGARIELGRGEPEELVARAERFARTLPQAVRPFGRPLLHADLRHAEGYALRLSGITTAAAVAASGPVAARAPRPRP